MAHIRNPVSSVSVKPSAGVGASKPQVSTSVLDSKKRKESTITAPAPKRAKTDDSDDDSADENDKYALVDKIFGGVNLNKSNLKGPEKPIDVKALLQPPKLTKPKPTPTKNDKAPAAGPKKANAKAPVAQKPQNPVSSMEDIKKRIEALKQKMAYNPNLHESSIKPISAKSKSSAPVPPARRSYRVADEDEEEEEEEEYDDEINDFIVDDEQEDWRKELRALTKYDPNKYRGLDYDDKNMEASWAEVRREEARSARIGREEDRLEELREQRRLQLLAEKKKKKKLANNPS